MVDQVESEVISRLLSITINSAIGGNPCYASFANDSKSDFT